jgi:hypothetical protein
MRKAFLEKYACGIISPKKVISMVEKANETIPVISESDNKVRRTLIPTLPQRIVVRRKFESFLKDNTLLAPLVCAVSASISRRNLVKLKKARLRPENIAD